MKKTGLTLFLSILLSSSCSAEEDYSSMSYWDFHPLHIGSNALWIANADVTERSHQNGEIYFRKSNVYLNLLVPISMRSYFIPRVDWVNFTLDWDKNPKISQTTFNYAQFALTFFSGALEDWRWVLRADYSLDFDHFSKPAMYGLFSGLLWGKYEIYDKWHYHVGTFFSVGLETTNVYPVLGLDYSPSKKWMFEIVFPIMYSIQYNIDENWRLSLKGRPLKERFRVGDDNPQPRSVFNYSSIGTELNLRYEQFLWLEAEIYAGYNFGGTYYIKNERGHSPLYTDVSSAPYGGASLEYGF